MQIYPDPYKVHYHNDGTGRDTYVGINSGGLFTTTKAPERAFKTVGNFNMERRATLKPAPVMQPMSPHYRSDGTGRDTNICINEGGLMHNAAHITDFRT